MQMVSNDRSKNTQRPPRKSILVPVTTIDKFCEERNLQTVDIIKIDAKGGDINVIKGAANTIMTRKVKMITAELGSSVYRPAWLDMVATLDE